MDGLLYRKRTSGVCHCRCAAIQRSIRAVYATGQYDDVQLVCELDEKTDRAIVWVSVKERPILAEVSVVGVNRLHSAGIIEKADIPLSKPLDPASVAVAIQRIDSTYQKSGYYLARVKAETTSVGDDAVRLTFRIDEGRRLAVSGIGISGNQHMDAKEIAGVMKTKPEGFWWWRKGEFDDENFAAPLRHHSDSELISNRGDPERFSLRRRGRHDSSTRHVQDVPIRILEPRNLHVTGDIHIAVAGHARHVVMLKDDTFRLEIRDLVLDVIDGPGHCRGLVRAGVIGPIHVDLMTCRCGKRPVPVPRAAPMDRKPPWLPMLRTLLLLLN